MSSAPPKRAPIEYNYAVGIALKNRQPLRAKEVYDVLKVHMPKLCTYHNDNWENAVRGCLTSSTGYFEKVDLISNGNEKPAYSFKFKEGAVEAFNKKFPFEYGAPYNFLTKPELHQKLYNGEQGYPTKEEIKTARALFAEEKAKWAGYQKEKKQKTEKKTTKKVVSTGIPKAAAVQNCGNNTVGPNAFEAQDDIQVIGVLGQIQNQILPTQNAPGPVRNQPASTVWSRLTPYQRQNQVVRRKPTPQVPQPTPVPLQEPANIQNNQENVPAQPASTAWSRLTVEQRQNLIVRPMPMHQIEQFVQENQPSQFPQQPLGPIEQGFAPLPTPGAQQSVYNKVHVDYYQNPMPYYQNQAQWAEPMYPMEQGPQPIQMVPNQYAEPAAEYHHPQNVVQQEEFPAEAPQVAQQGAVSEEDLGDLFGVVVEEDQYVDYFLQNAGGSTDSSKKHDVPVLEELQIPNYDSPFHNPINNDPLAIAMDEILGHFDLFGNY